MNITGRGDRKRDREEEREGEAEEGRPAEDACCF